MRVRKASGTQLVLPLYWGVFAGLFAQVLGVGLLLNLMALATPIYILMVYDRVIASQSSDTLKFMAIGVAIAIVH